MVSWTWRARSGWNRRSRRWCPRTAWMSSSSYLSGVSFMDSAGLGSLLSTHERLEDLGINAKVRRPSREVERVLDASGTRTL